SLDARAPRQSAQVGEHRAAVRDLAIEINARRLVARDLFPRQKILRAIVGRASAPFVRQLDRADADARDATLGREPPETLVLVARHAVAQERDVEEPDQASAVVMMRDAMDAREQQRVDVRESEGVDRWYVDRAS